MKKRFFLCLLVLCTLLTALPILGLTASAAQGTVVATVVEGDKTIRSTDNLLQALTTAGEREGCTVQLQSDIELNAGFDLKGTYTLDLNGYVITAHAPLILTSGNLTIIDSSDTGSGAIRGTNRLALELRGTTVDGVATATMTIASGTFGASDSDFAVHNNGTGILYLTGTPKFEKGIYLTAPKTLYASDMNNAAYTGDLVKVYYGEKTVSKEKRSVAARTGVGYFFRKSGEKRNHRRGEYFLLS
jgi:hypothetical protein